MRRSVLHRIFLFSAMTVALLLAVVSCIKEEKIILSDTSGNLSLLPKLFDDGIDYLRGHTKVQSKAKEDEDPDITAGDDVNARSVLNENLIETLDVFIKKEADDEDTPWIYVKHLDKDQAGAVLNMESPGGLLEKAKHLINKNWGNELTTENKPFDPQVQYHIYVTANNPHTHLCNHTTHHHYSYRVEGSTIPESLEDLKALHTYDAKTDCYYTPDPVPERTNRVNEKAFLMDGDILWSPEPEQGEQIWDVDLKRAVSKVIVTLQMDDNFKDEISNKPDGKNWTAGEPMWRYVHFGFDVADIASGTYELDKSQSGGNPWNTNPFKTGSLNNTDVIDADLWQWYIKTYTAPFKWRDYTESPYLLLSVRYTFTPDNPDDTLMLGSRILHYNDQRTCYYRIPICEEQKVADQGLQRNNIYIVDAKIASWGSENEEFEAEDFYLDLEYHVVPWTETNVDHESTIVKLGDIKYLTVYPQEYTLKGNLSKSVDFNWYASVSTDDGQFPDIDVSSLKVTYINYQGNETSIKGTVVKDPVTPNGLNDITITSTATNANNEKVIIKLSTDGIITVTSEALLNRAVKTIEFDVELKTTTLPKKHVVIRHFPLDNIQSISGHWSSRWDGASSTQTVREYSFNPTASGWSSSDGYEDNIECTLAEYNSAEPAHRYTGTKQVTISATRANFLANVTTNDDRTNANGEANAINGYWGETAIYTSYASNNPGLATNSNNWDFWSPHYYQSINGVRTYGVGTYVDDGYYNEYKYQNYYTKVEETAYYARRYYRDVTTTAPPSTGSWVDWARDSAQTYNAANVKYTEGNSFIAKVYNASNGNIYAINVTRSTSGGQYRYTYNRATSQAAQGYNTYNESTGYVSNRNSGMTGLTNNHMYVIQVTSTSDTYVLGKPVLDANYQS
ncbi:MAG: hypothetical protein IKX26_07925, partial [Bacteroidales bacterium]|nr:hypothetical protein [Bacteroidales bacterium]